MTSVSEKGEEMEKKRMLKKSVLTIIFIAGLIAAFNLSAKSKLREIVPLKNVGLSADEIGVGKELFSLQESFVNVAKSIKPAVVQITTEKTVTLRYWDPFGNFEEFFRSPFEDFFGQQRPEKRKEFKQKQKGLGSGFIIDPKGYILTNNHVVEGVDKIMVKLLGKKKELKAKVVGTDRRTDLALLKVKGIKPFPSIKLGDSDNIRVGEWAIAIGNPFGLEETVTVGVISAKGRRGFGIGQYEDFIQTDASINPGNSGGPLVNIKGEVIGINTFIIAPSVASGIGFAIPINMTKNVLVQLREKGKVVRGWLGIIIQPLSEELAKSFGLKKAEGVLIGDVMKNSPAEKGGLKRGDVIIQLEKKVVREPLELQTAVADTSPGRIVSVKIIREKKETVLKIKIGEMPAEKELIAEEEKERGSWRGLKVEAITEDLMKMFKMRAREGVIVSNVEPGSQADEAGIRRGVIIKQINREKIENITDYHNIIKGIKKRRDAILLVQEGRYTRFVILKGERD